MKKQTAGEKKMAEILKDTICLRELHALGLIAEREERVTIQKVASPLVKLDDCGHAAYVNVVRLDDSKTGRSIVTASASEAFEWLDAMGVTDGAMTPTDADEVMDKVYRGKKFMINGIVSKLVYCYMDDGSDEEIAMVQVRGREAKPMKTEYLREMAERREIELC